MANINKIKLPDGVTYNVQDTVSGYTTNTGTVTGVKVGSTPYSPSSGVVSLPAYPTTLPASDTTNTYSSTGTAPVNGTAVAAALGTLDGTVSGSAGAGKTLTAFSQTDGKVSATFGNISITKSQVSDLGTIGTAAAKAYTTSVTSGSSDLVTSGAVYTAIANLPEPMIFKGTLGTGGTITSLPTAAAANEGFTYKVITAGTYASQTAKVGDLFIYNGSAWVLVPSGDDTATDTWRNIKINGTEKIGTGISTGAVDFVNGTNTTVSYTASGNKVAINATDTKYTATTTSIGSASAGTAIAADDITAWSAGTVPTLGTAISADDITAWSANTPTSCTISQGVLTFTAGSAASLSYTAKSIPNVTSVGTAPSLSYTSRSIPNISVTATTVATGITAS